MSESEPTNETSRVAQSDEIVRQLEKSVPRWEGFGPGGWSITIQLVRFSFLSFLGSCVDEGGEGGRFIDCRAYTGLQGREVRARRVSACKNLVILTHSCSGTRLSAGLDAVPDMDLKLNFPQVVGVPHYIRRPATLTLRVHTLYRGFSSAVVPIPVDKQRSLQDHTKSVRDLPQTMLGQ